MKALRISIGMVLWLAAGAYLWSRLASTPEGEVVKRTAPELARFAVGERRAASVRFEAPQELAAGDPIFVFDALGQARQIGEVRSSAGATGAASVLFYSGAPELRQGAQVVYYETPGSLEWVLKTMLPPEKREAVAHEVSAALAAHQDEILAALRPVVEASLREGFAVVEQDLADSLQRHKPELERLGGKYQRELVERELVPLVRQEVWPIVRRHAEPVAQEVGHEIWQRASLWRFGWRLAYDQSPLPERQLVRREWERFVERDVVPVLEAHTDDFVRAQQAILSDVAKNPRVQTTVRQGLARIVDDPQLQQVVWQIVRETIVDNPRLRQTLHRHWTGPEAQAAFSLAAERLEPTAVRIGELIFGTRDEGLTPEFARVLRNQILGKDKRWLVLEEGPPGAAFPRGAGQLVLPGRIGGEPAINPFVPVPQQTFLAGR